MYRDCAILRVRIFINWLLQWVLGTVSATDIIEPGEGVDLKTSWASIAVRPLVSRYWMRRMGDLFSCIRKLLHGEGKRVTTVINVFFTAGACRSSPL